MNRKPTVYEPITPEQVAQANATEARVTEVLRSIGSSHWAVVNAAELVRKLLAAGHIAAGVTAAPAPADDRYEQKLWLNELFTLIETWNSVRDGTPSKAEAWNALWKHAQNIGPGWRARAAHGVTAAPATDLLRRTLDTFNALLGDMEGHGSWTQIDDDLLPEVRARVAELSAALGVEGRTK